MRRLAVGGGLILLVACFCASPVEAICNECRFGGVICNGTGWCYEVWTCSGIQGFCSSCWEMCTEDHFGGFCNLSNPCQWTEMLPDQSAPDLEMLKVPTVPMLAP